MRRLTPDKIYGYSLPKARRINRGNTSIIYESDDPTKLEVFTIEWLKLEWWQKIGLIETYGQVCNAVYTGYNRLSYHAQFKRITLPVYRCQVLKLDQPGAAQVRRIRAIRRMIDNLRIPYNQTRQIYTLNRWDAIAGLGIAEIQPALDFICNWDRENVYPDFGPGDFMSWHDEIVCLDPFHHCELSEALHLTN